MTDLL